MYANERQIEFLTPQGQREFLSVPNYSLHIWLIANGANKGPDNAPTPYKNAFLARSDIVS
jgi:hypothetical protein